MGARPGTHPAGSLTAPHIPGVPWRPLWAELRSGTSHPACRQEQEHPSPSRGAEGAPATVLIPNRKIAAAHPRHTPKVPQRPEHHPSGSISLTEPPTLGLLLPFPSLLSY